MVGYKPHRLSLRCIFSLKEKYRALIRVKTVQYRKQKAVRKRQRANRDYDLGKTPHSQEKDWFKLTETQADAFSAFWKGIWEIEGECNLRHQMVEEWRKEMREQTKPPEGTLEVPQWMVSGRTVMIPKEDCKGEPGQFRPITCLNTSYKLLTGTLAVILTQHVHRKSVLPAEQKEKEVTEVVWMLSLLMQRSQGTPGYITETCQWHGSILGRPSMWCHTNSSTECSRRSELRNASAEQCDA